MNYWQRTRVIIKLCTGLMLGFIALQSFPIWHLEPALDPRNPPVRYRVAWAAGDADHIMEQVCYTCHSNETEYPIYMRIAPLSWVAAQHVNEGRAHLNFSEQPLNTINPNLLVTMIQAELMPPPLYRLTHPEANLTDAQKERLIQSILTTFQQTDLHNPTTVAQLRTPS